MYTQMKRNPLNKMTRGKAVLIGDACHPMLLTHAQGVSSSLEDAAALEIFLADVPTSDAVSSAPSELLLQRLQQFEAFRLPRVSATQILTDPVVPGPEAAAKYARQEAEIRKYYSGPLPPTGAMPHSPPICQFFFGYDVRKEAYKVLEQAAEKDKPVETSAPVPSPPEPVGQPLAEAPTAAPVEARPVQENTPVPQPPVIQTRTFAPVEQPTVDPMERRLAEMEKKLAEMERKLAVLMKVTVSTVEVTSTPPQIPPAFFDIVPSAISA